MKAPIKKLIKKSSNSSFYYGENLYVCINYGFSPISYGYDIYLRKNNLLDKRLASVNSRKMLFPILRTIIETEEFKKL